MMKNITVHTPRKAGKGFEQPVKVAMPKQKRSNSDLLLNLFSFIGEIAVKRKRSS
jgi:hypothetical protein